MTSWGEIVIYSSLLILIELTHNSSLTPGRHCSSSPLMLHTTRKLRQTGNIKSHLSFYLEPGSSICFLTTQTINHRIQPNAINQSEVSSGNFSQSETKYSAGLLDVRKITNQTQQNSQGKIYDREWPLETKQTEKEINMKLNVEIKEEEYISEVLTLLSVRRVYPVLGQYHFFTPRITLSCYCQCDSSPCQLASCKSCYNFTSRGAGCSSHAPGAEQTTISTTCCSARLSEDGPPHLGLKIGPPVLIIEAKVELFSRFGDQIGVKYINTTGDLTKISMNINDRKILLFTDAQTSLFDLRSQIESIKGSWGVVKYGESKLRFPAMNSGREEDPLLPGWVKAVHDPTSGDRHGWRLRPPPPSIVQRGVHIRTESCGGQDFQADISGLNSQSDFGPESPLVFTEKSTVEESLSSRIQFSYITIGPRETSVFQNITQLNEWNCEAYVDDNKNSYLIFRFRNSCGQFLGRVNNLVFSVSLSICRQKVQERKVPLPPGSIKFGSDIVVCLEAGHESCRTVPIFLKEDKVGADLVPAVPKPAAIETIPVLWKKQIETRSDLGFEPVTVLSSLLRMSSSETMSLVVNSVLGLMALVIIVKLMHCLIPKCNKK